MSIKEIARNALAFYADQGSWIKVGETPAEAIADRGNVARQALQTIEAISGEFTDDQVREMSEKLKERAERAFTKSQVDEMEAKIEDLKNPKP